MLTADLVPVQRRGDTLRIRDLSPDQRDRLLAAAGAYLAIVREHNGRTYQELERRWDDVENEPTDFKLLKGLRKLLEDRCTFEVTPGLDAPALRHAVFTEAARYRRELSDTEEPDFQQVLRKTAPDYSEREGSRESWLFGDLREHQVLIKFDPVDAATLVSSYEWAQRQAVLLRAVRVSLVLHGQATRGLRYLFHQLKFRRLLYAIQPREGGGYNIEVDGPFSLFQAVTKYGLGLALLLPTLDSCGPWTLDAKVRWDQSQKLFDFHLEGGQVTTTLGEMHWSDEVKTLVTRIRKAARGWTVAQAKAILDLPGIGLCIPDLVFRHPDHAEPFYLEVMGYWSRDAVWRRVELVQAGLRYRILFAVSTRLRVSERVLDGDLPGQLCVYKGIITAADILDRLDAMRQGLKG